MFISAAVAATEAVGEAGHQGSGVFPPFDPTFFVSQVFWLALSFGAFYIFMSRAVLPRIGGVLETRAERIAKDLDQANAMKAESDAAIAAYEQSLTSARNNANEIAGKARDVAKADAEAVRQKIERDLAMQMEAAERRIGDIKAKALGNLSAIAEETTSTIVSRLFGGKVDQSEVADAVKAARAQ